MNALHLIQSKIKFFFYKYNFTPNDHKIYRQNRQKSKFYLYFYEYTKFLCTYFFQIFVVGPQSNPLTTDLLNVVRSRLIPGRLLVFADGPDGRSSHLHSRVHILPKLKMVDDKPTAYVCRHSSCSLPVTNVQQLVNLLDEEKCS